VLTIESTQNEADDRLTCWVKMVSFLVPGTTTKKQNEGSEEADVCFGLFSGNKKSRFACLVDGR